jgi:hypothetical protein
MDNQPAAARIGNGDHIANQHTPTPFRPIKVDCI